MALLWPLCRARLELTNLHPDRNIDRSSVILSLNALMLNESTRVWKIFIGIELSERKKVVGKALEKLGVGSPSEIFRVAVEIDPHITLRDVNFELYNGTRSPKNPIYQKTGKGKYSLLRKT